MDKRLEAFWKTNREQSIESLKIHKEKVLTQNQEYIELNNKITRIMKIYPKIQRFLKKGIIVDMTDEEKDAVRRVVEARERMHTLEQIEALKIGAKEMYVYLEKNDMLIFKV